MNYQKKNLNSNLIIEVSENFQYEGLLISYIKYMMKFIKKIEKSEIYRIILVIFKEKDISKIRIEIKKKLY